MTLGTKKLSAKIIGNSHHERVITYGIDNKADVHAKNIELTAENTKFVVCYQNEEVAVSWNIIGRFNIYNFLGAVAAGITKGFDFKQICDTLSTFKGIPGRLEAIHNNKGINIYVDYAHTDDAIKNALECLQEIKKKKIIIVFGCGGNRDQSKRPKMAQVAERLSDLAIVTSDNPRNENISDICHDIVQGFTDPGKYFVETDRKKAIGMAIKQAEPGDIVLIAGKGHETYQTFAHQTIEFDDRIVATTLCNL
jgi:UDP-N-acetylmuramoyl-L-alanyl-D-glutamate--2,6-diaminopimelate ligase